MHKHNCFQDSLYPTHRKIKLAENTPVSQDFQGCGCTSVVWSSTSEGKRSAGCPLPHSRTEANHNQDPNVCTRAKPQSLQNRIWIQTSSKLEGLDPMPQPGSTYWWDLQVSTTHSASPCNAFPTCWILLVTNIILFNCCLTACSCILGPYM